MSDVQIFGVASCAETRKAQRFFKERRLKVHFNDLKQRAASKGELRRFSQKYGIDALIDREAKRFKSLGLHQAHYGEDRWLDIAADEPLILRTPLVRRGHDLTIGWDESFWRDRL